MSPPFDSAFVDVAGRPVHVADFGGAGTPIVCVHGLGGSHANWVPVAPELRSIGRVTAIDLPGFGLTPPLGRSTTVAANRAVLGDYLEALGRPAVLVGNSMGGLISMMQASADPESVRGQVLISPASPRAPGVGLDRIITALFSLYLLPGAAALVLAGRRRVQSAEEIARFTLELCTPQVGRIRPDIIRHHVDIAEERLGIPGVDHAFVEAARSLLATLIRRRRFDRMLAAITAPTMVIHGRGDRLVKVESTLRLSSLRPDWQLELLDDVGHIAMLEVPVTVGSIVRDWASTSRAA